MDSQYGRFVSSQPFRFLVGPDKTTFYVHAELLTQCSDSLRVLVGGPMTEASQRCAVLEEIEEDTVVQFIEYLYTKNYTVPQPDIVLKSSDIGSKIGDESLQNGRPVDEVLEDAPPLPEEEVEMTAPIPDLNWGMSSKQSKKKDKKMQSNRWQEESEPVMDTGPYGLHNCKKDLMWTAFQDKASIEQPKAWQARPNEEPCEDYTRVFLCHARLYVFSDQHNIEHLRDLTLKKLRLTLSAFHLFDERVPDVVELLRYTYAHTMEHDDGIDKLRSLVTDYVVCKLEMIVKDDGFGKMLKEPGALAMDLMAKSLQRLD